MKRIFMLLFVIIVGLLILSAPGAVKRTTTGDSQGPGLTVPTRDISGQKRSLLNRDFNLGKVPLYFIANKGQVNKKAKFYAKASRYTLWLTKEGLVFDSMKKVEFKPGGEETNTLQSPHSPNLPKFNRDVSRFLFLDANKNPDMVPIHETQHKVNYFTGHDKSRWNCDIPTSQAVLYKTLYKNIDLKVYGLEKQVEYDWIVKPGGNPGDIKFLYQNVKDTRIDDEGNLLIETDLGQLMHKKPVAYQEVSRAQCTRNTAQSPGRGAGPRGRLLTQDSPGNENQTAVEVTFKKTGKNTYSFNVGKYDKDYELIIDPVVLLYSEYYGGHKGDSGMGIAVDSSGYIYVVGNTESTDFPTSNSYQTDQPNVDVFVMKINKYFPLHPLYSTYLGGQSYEIGKAVAVDGSGYVYVTGYTCSANFPTKNQYQGYQGGQTDAFIVKLDTTRSGAASLLYSTFLGGSAKDNSYAIAVDNNECVYVTGETNSRNFPTLDQYQGFQGNWDAFVTKLDTTKKGASCLIYSTYLGGWSQDVGYGIAVDGSGYVYVAGATKSPDFPTLNQYQKDQIYWDAFVTKLDPTQGGALSLIYSTYFGGTKIDEANAIAVDDNGNAYVAGSECDAPVVAYGECPGVFVIQIDTTRKGASSLINYLFMEEYMYGFGITMDSSGNIYIAGIDFNPSPQSSAFRGYLTKIGPDFDIIYSTFLDFACKGVSLDRSGYVYVAGGSGDAYVARLITDPIVLPTITTLAASSLTETSASCGGHITFDGGVPVTGRGVCWSTSQNPALSDNHTTDGIGTGTFTGSLTGLNPNTTYYARAYATNLAGTAYGNEVTFTTPVLEPPYIRLNRSQLYFGAVIGGSQTGSQTFFIGNSGEGSLNWTASVSGTWLQVSPLSGTDNINVTVPVNITGLAPGSYTGVITITDPNAGNSPAIVSIHLEVKTKAQELPPFGYFDTPLEGSLVFSSIPVTGWALDDIGMSSVKIFRNPVKGEKGLVYIGDGIFVAGARPDVEAQFPVYPQNYQAGWGYMMLTNFLPNSGNGTFVITAIAADSSGNEVTLGSKTITCDNANAVKPFGAIDTPTQGGTASGSNFINWGWVLTPQPNSIPSDGSTINVYVDGVNIGHPTYNIYRKDIAALFPGYVNSNGAVGYGILNTTAYDNGVHTIQWTATDTAGNTDGIGSRYFTIQNTSPDHQTYPQAFLPSVPLNGIPLNALDDSYDEPIRIKKGYNPNIEPGEIYPNDNDEGVVTIEINQLERVEIHIAQPFAKKSGIDPLSKFSGCLVVENQYRPLPIGSFMDTQRGVFYWQPGAGFLGEYQFVFFEKRTANEYKKKYISVIIRPKFSDI